MCEGYTAALDSCQQLERKLNSTSSLMMRYCRSEGTSFPPFVPLPPSISPSLPPYLSPSLPPYLSPSLDLSLPPSLPQSLPPSLLPSLSPSLPTPSTPPAGISLWFLPPSPSPTSSSLQEAQEAAVGHTPTDTVIYMYLCRSILALPFQVEMVCGW